MSELHIRVCACVRVCVIYTGGGRQRENAIKELAHAVLEAGKSKICRASQQATDLGKS